MKRLVVIVATCGVLAACGGASSKGVVLRSSNPSVPVVYLQVTGSSDAATTSIAGMLEHAWSGAGLVAAPAVHGKQVCTRTIPMVTYPVTVPSLRGLGGQKI